MVYALLYIGLFAAMFWAQPAAKVDFARDIQPLLRENCVECHGPAQQMRGLRLDRRRDALPNRVGANGARIVPGDAAMSTLYRRVSGSQAGPQMPPSGPLKPEQIALIKSWIEQGAEWPDALSGDRGATLADAAVVRYRDALRSGKRATIDPKSVNAKGPNGWTPLMYAVLYGSADSVRSLLKKSANPNATNDDGGTALMYAIEDAEKVKLLLANRADPNLRSGEGRTALLIAAGQTISYPAVKLLLEHGADVNVKLPNGTGVFSIAGASRDVRVLQLLVDRGVEKGPLPFAASLPGCADCFDFLLKHAEPGDLPGALQAAIRFGDLPRVQLLLDRGTQAGGNLLQSVALAPAAIPSATIKTLISRGARVDAQTPAGWTMRDLAKRQANMTLVEALADSGLRDDGLPPAALRPQPAQTARAAIERVLPSLQRADVAFFERAGCVSCHNNSLTAMNVAAARAKGIDVNEHIAKDQLRKIASFLEANAENALENVALPGTIDTVSYILLGMASENYPSNTMTDVWARYVKNNQAPDGRWKCATLRPPLESSDFEVTAASIRAVRAYGPPSQRAEYERAARRGVRWLEHASPATTEDHAFKILGLVWGGGSKDAIRATAQGLLALQRSDGGWGQVEGLPSDAYATGQALVALNQARAVAVNDPAYGKGIQFLMNSQLEDGSWYVRTRAIAIQPYFDSDFPHRTDQFISAAASNWASMALLTAVR
jgi:ankyrin repeat protein